MSETRVTVGDGKYEIVLRDDGASELLRHGESKGLPNNVEYGLACDLRDARETIAAFKRLLNPVRMSLSYQALADNPIPDGVPLFNFMGGGGSDVTTVDEFRALMGDERQAVAEMEQG